MKKIINILLILGLSLLLSSFFYGDSLSLNLIEILYTVSGILFSVGIGLVVTFKLGNVKHPTYRREIKKSVLTVRNSFFFYFAISTIIFILCSENKDSYLSINTNFVNISLNLSFLSLITIIISMIYYITNFIALQKLNDDIENLDE